MSYMPQFQADFKVCLRKGRRLKTRSVAEEMAISQSIIDARAAQAVGIAQPDAAKSPAMSLRMGGRP
jgi:hypothetical protein